MLPYLLNSKTRSFPPHSSWGKQMNVLLDSGIRLLQLQSSQAPHSSQLEQSNSQRMQEWGRDGEAQNYSWPSLAPCCKEQLWQCTTCSFQPAPTQQGKEGKGWAEKEEPVHCPQMSPVELAPFIAALCSAGQEWVGENSRGGGEQTACSPQYLPTHQLPLPPCHCCFPAAVVVWGANSKITPQSLDSRLIS